MFLKYILYCRKIQIRNENKKINILQVITQSLLLLRGLLFFEFDCFYAIVELKFIILFFQALY